MKKNDCIRYVMQHMATYPVELNGVSGRFTVAATREIKVVYHFNINELPDTIRLLGAYEFHIDVKVDDDMKKRLLALTDDEVFTLGRAPECDKQVAKFEENRISRLHCILQKVGNEILIVNLGHYGTIALKKTEFGLESMASFSELWEDADWLHAHGMKTKKEMLAEAEAKAAERTTWPWWKKLWYLLTGADSDYE